jgi:hypothetical protein
MVYYGTVLYKARWPRIWRTRRHVRARLPSPSPGRARRAS